MAIWAFFILIVSICMINLLIAKMNGTYGDVTDNAESMWQLERARIIMALECEEFKNKEDREKILSKFFVKSKGDTEETVSYLLTVVPVKETEHEVDECKYVCFCLAQLGIFCLFNSCLFVV